MRRADAVEINCVLASMTGWKRLDKGYRFGSVYGHQRGFIRA